MSSFLGDRSGERTKYYVACPKHLTQQTKNGLMISSEKCTCNYGSRTECYKCHLEKCHLE